MADLLSQGLNECLTWPCCLVLLPLQAFAFTSGMAALAVVTKLAKVGEHIVAGDDIYGGTSRLLSQVVPNAGVSVSNVDMSDLGAVRQAMVPGKTSLVMVESPTNPRMQVGVNTQHVVNPLAAGENYPPVTGSQLPLNVRKSLYSLVTHVLVVVTPSGPRKTGDCFEMWLLQV